MNREVERDKMSLLKGDERCLRTYVFDIPNDVSLYINNIMSSFYNHGKKAKFLILKKREVKM
jgi:hypothetical protein